MIIYAELENLCMHIAVLCCSVKITLG